MDKSVVVRIPIRNYAGSKHTPLNTHVCPRQWEQAYNIDPYSLFIGPCPTNLDHRYYDGDEI